MAAPQDRAKKLSIVRFDLDRGAHPLLGLPSTPAATCVTWTDDRVPYLSVDRLPSAHWEPRPAAGALPSVGSIGDAFDNALAETTIGLFKTELFKPRAPWRTAEQIEIAVLEWIDWYNHRRLHEHCGDIPPAELEQAHYRQHSDLAEAGTSTN